MIVDSKEITISLPQKKLQSIPTDVSRYVLEPRGNSFRVNKGVTSPGINNFGYLPVKLHCRFLQQQQIEALRENGSYESQVLVNKESQLELL